MIHGGDIYTEGVLQGKELIDFSSNINPLGVPESFKNKIEEALLNVVNYPDIKYRGVKDALARYEGISEEYFILGNGAAEIIDLSLARVKKVMIMAPSFAEYEISARKRGNEIKYFYLQEFINEDGTYSMKVDYDRLLEDLNDVDGMIIANPNNPDGHMLDKGGMKSILDFCESRGKRVIIDEAFIHFTLKEGGSFVPLTEKYSCLIVIKALTKYYGMPGIRFGYGITRDGDFKSEMENMQLPWNINTFAVEGVKAVLFDEGYDKKSREWIRGCREFLLGELKKRRVFSKVYKTNGNYVLCELRDITSKEFYNRCLKRGFLIRNADNYEGLSDGHIRLAIKDMDRNRKLLDMLDSEF